MAAEMDEITESYPPEMHSERALLLDIQARLERLDRHLTALLEAWSSGGVRGLRTAAREHANGRN